MTNTANRFKSSLPPAVHIFNPTNDEALASNNRWYTPSRHARQYQVDCELLPIWWANDGDYIIAPNHTDEEIARTAHKANINISRYCPGDAAIPSPWGWSNDAKRQFADAGLPVEFLPSDEEIESIRSLSHRKLAIDVNKSLTVITGQSAPNRPRLCPDINQIDICGGDNMLLKRPWSSSGRGTFPTNTLSDIELQRLAGGIIRRQGSVVIEDALDKVMDFSCLFRAEEAAITHQAWSLFHTTGDGRYMGSLVDTQCNIMGSLRKSGILYGKHPVDFDMLQRQIITVLSSLISPDYNGWIGVDMLGYRDSKDGHIHIAPCIEVNLRMTMGVVAVILAQKLSPLSSNYILRTMSPGSIYPDGSISLVGDQDGFSIILESIL